MNDNTEWQNLIERHLRGELTDAEKERLAELLDTQPDAREELVQQAQWDTELAEALRERSDAFTTEESLLSSREPRNVRHEKKSNVSFLKLATVAVVVLACAAGLFYRFDLLGQRNGGSQVSGDQPRETESSIAKIVGVSGSLIWTGDRGAIVRDVKVGTELAGGTIEGMAPDSWFELQFHDGSTVMISGTSLLTFSDIGQKELRLREGIFSANVVPQPAGKPMLIHTRSALLKVLGTQFEVRTSLTSTELNVSEGKVRLRRHSDGLEVDVPAKHRAIAGDDPDMTPQRVPDSTNSWNSRLDLGPTKAWGNYGKWLPSTAEKPAAIKAIPFVPRENKKVTLHLLGLPVVQQENLPVVVQANSIFRIHGRLNLDADVHFGIRVTYPNGELAGKFITRQQSNREDGVSEFEMKFPLADFELDPCVRDRKEELASRPDGLVLTGVWAFTHTGGPTGLEISEVELIPPQSEEL